MQAILSLLGGQMTVHNRVRAGPNKTVIRKERYLPDLWQKKLPAGMVFIGWRNKTQQGAAFDDLKTQILIMKVVFIRTFACWLLVQLCLPAVAQQELNSLVETSFLPDYFASGGLAPRKLFQRNTGIILGWQRGRYTAIEMGVEAHWRKISLLKPHIIGATANMEYNFGNNVLGYKAGAWMKRGRINLTYGVNVSYFTNFKDGHRFGFGPSVGFRLLGFHLLNGFNFLTDSKSATNEDLVPANSLYISLRYYFPVQNRFVWDRQTRLKKKERQEAREQRRKERAERRRKGDGGIFRIFKKGKNE